MFGCDMSKSPKGKLLRIVAYVVSVYEPMFLKFHLNPRASDYPSIMLFLRDLLLDYRWKDEVLVNQGLKKVFVIHFVSWMNPISVALNVFSKNPSKNPSKSYER